MLKFIRGKGQQPSAERQKLQKELFAFRKTAQHGFPHKPSAIAYDNKKSLIAIGTSTGVIKVFGQPGVEFYGQHTSTINGNASDCSVQLLEWIPDTGRILSLVASNQLVLWEPAGAMLVPLRTLPFDGKLKKVSSLCCSYGKDTVWVGTEGGNVYQFDLETFAVREPVIYHDVVLEQVPASYKLNPGAIESVKQLPNNFNHLLIAYNRGLCVLWDLETASVIRAYIAPGHGQSVGLFVTANGEEFTWYHADGSYATWDVESTNPPPNQNYVPYGPDPCKSINRMVQGMRSNKEIVIFSGGMPRSAYGEHQCVSVHCKDGTKVALDFTSKVIDFIVTFAADDAEQVEVLIVLLEEELVAYDLTMPSLAPIKTPYLHSVHATAVTCNHLVSQVTQSVYDQIVMAGKMQEMDFSEKEWPITGGDLRESQSDSARAFNTYEIMLTGHEDGCVRFWDCSTIVLKPLLNFKTGVLFKPIDSEQYHGQEPLEDSEPPFRKAGQFDPYTDDPRQAVKKVAFCPKTGALVVAGTAGHIVMANFESEHISTGLRVTTMNLVSDRDGFVWKGHDQLKVKNSLLEYYTPGEEGIPIVGIIQVLPPAAITCLALQSEWNVVAAGTAHGLVVFDFQDGYPIVQKCTLNPSDLTGAGDTLSRRKSFKKTLRESFRRLRKGRSTRNNPAQANAAAQLDTRPIERQVEARPVDDGMGSMVRCVTFAKTYITNVHTTTATLWSATNSSCVSVFVLNVPPNSGNNDNNTNDGETTPRRQTTGQLAKEIQLKHRAPVVGIAVFDQNGVPVDQSVPGSGPHRVLIASEEQFKVFSLPQLKPITKYKLTAHEGARVRRINFALFTCPITPEMLSQSSPSKALYKTADGSIAGLDVSATGEGAPAESADSNPIHNEFALLCLTNLGDCLVLSVPEIKRQLNAAAVRREDINGISSLCFTNHGEALYMMSSSELQRISLSATKITCPMGIIEMDPLADSESMSSALMEQVQDDNCDTTTDVAVRITEMVDRTTAGIDNLMTNGESSPNRGNETITSSIGDITVDSVRDHLNSTTTTLCSQTTEEVLGRVSVLSTQTNSTITNVNSKDIVDSAQSAGFKELAKLGETIDTSTKSVVIKSVITSISHSGTNGEPETVSTKTVSTTRKESQF